MERSGETSVTGTPIEWKDGKVKRRSGGREGGGLVREGWSGLVRGGVRWADERGWEMGW